MCEFRAVNGYSDPGWALQTCSDCRVDESTHRASRPGNRCGDGGDLRSRFVELIYASHNRSPQIRNAVRRCLKGLASDELGLNVGAGSTDLHPAVINVDLGLGPAIHCCAKAEHLPFAADSFSLVLSQETLEHVRDPDRALREMNRVLRKDGTLYCQVPFIIGYHPGPTDFWRFTKEGIKEVVERAGFVCDEVSMAVGPATGFYRIAVEFGSILVSRFAPKFYRPAKAALALLLYPVKLLDGPLSRAGQVDRIAGGYYVIARKTR
jgi:SAM-dependent methyltransferase